MSRIAAAFERLQAQGRKALIPFITAGDPDAQMSLELMRALAGAGADVIELGMPFSDPMSDGAVIQRASERALSRGMNLERVLQTVRDFRAYDALTPVVLMGYANPVEYYDQTHGVARFAKDASASGVDGLLIVDYPPEESHDFAKQLKSQGLDQIFLLAPTSTDARMAMVGELAQSGFVYCVSLRGVTGAASLNVQTVADFLPKVRSHVNLPVCVGFGIRDAASAKAVVAFSDGVVIGSRLIELIEKVPREQVVATAQAFIAEIRHAVDEG